jgi:hypothetical protein
MSSIPLTIRGTFSGCYRILTIVPWRPAFYLVTAATYLFGTNLGAPGEPMYRLNTLLYAGLLFMVGYDWLARLSIRLKPRLAPDRKLRHTNIADTVDARSL